MACCVAFGLYLHNGNIILKFREGSLETRLSLESNRMKRKGVVSDNYLLEWKIRCHMGNIANAINIHMCD